MPAPPPTLDVAAAGERGRDSQRAVIPRWKQLVLQNRNALAILVGALARESCATSAAARSAARAPARDARASFRAADATARHSRGRGAARRRRCECVCGTRRLSADHPADRAGRLPEQRPEELVQCGVRVLLPCVRADPADLRRLPPQGAARSAARPPGGAAADLPPQCDRRVRRCRERTHRHRADRRARAAASARS